MMDVKIINQFQEVQKKVFNDIEKDQEYILLSGSLDNYTMLPYIVDLHTKAVLENRGYHVEYICRENNNVTEVSW
jgi:hypothetical protein